MENNSPSEVKALFAKNKIVGIVSFDTDIAELLEYYEGVFVSTFGDGPGAFSSRDDGVTTKHHKTSNDVTTTVEVYRIFIVWYVQDTGDEDNIGIWQLFIIKYDDDPDSQYSYGGDGSTEPGIYIGKTG